MSQDIISYKQKIILIIEDNKMNKLKSDENYYTIIKALRKGPMTVNDLVKKFEEEGIKKSDKSIYRYLKTLIEMKLVARAGKRITSLDEKDLHSETIYTRTARIFTGSLKLKEEKIGKEKTDELFDLIFTVLQRKYPSKISSADGVRDLLYKFDNNKNDILLKLLEDSDDEIFQKVADLDWSLIDSFIEFISWLGIMLEFDIEAEIEKCCPE